MSASHPLDESLIKALAYPLRWRLLELMTERGESSPVELARHLDLPLATVSHHMRVLRDLRCVQLSRTAIQERSDARREDRDDVRLSEVALLHFELTSSPSTGDRALAPPKRSPQLR
jgi:DNA-binding transcriptional ArsR family regulator